MLGIKSLRLEARVGIGLPPALILRNFQILQQAGQAQKARSADW